MTYSGNSSGTDKALVTEVQGVDLGFFAGIYQRVCRSYVNRQVAEEISAVTAYADELLQLEPLPQDSQALFNACRAPKKAILARLSELKRENADSRRVILLNGNGNHSFDIEGLLREIGARINRHDRVVIVAYNPYFRWLYRLASALGIRRGDIPLSFVTRASYRTIAELAGFSVVRERPVVYFPLPLWGIGTFLNRFLQAIPLLRWTGLASVQVLRPIMALEKCPSVSIVIPARNERGNIAAALARLPDLGTATEVIFIEGHSSDGTWEEIQRVVSEYKGPLRLQMAQQQGKGKSDAVRLGFSLAKHELLTILDADLTMPPEQLPRFLEAYRRGLGDFINGNRLVYPMEGEAMRFLNHLGNLFFAKLLSFVLETPLGDSLCGTKLVHRRDYERFKAWRKDFGDFDPFGDFELIFPACTLGLGVVDLPIRYLARTYGSTNIHRFRHGFILLQMSTIGLIRIRHGFGKKL